MSITIRQAEDLLTENYGDAWADGDPEWWSDMTDYLMEFRSVKHLRHGGDALIEWRVPRWWPGAVPASDRP